MGSKSFSGEKIYATVCATGETTQKFHTIMSGALKGQSSTYCIFSFFPSLLFLWLQLEVRKPFLDAILFLFLCNKDNLVFFVCFL